MLLQHQLFPQIHFAKSCKKDLLIFNANRYGLYQTI